MKHSTEFIENLLLRRSPLTGRIFAITRWKEHSDGTIEALDKFDVTDEFNALLDGSAVVARSGLAHLVTVHERLSASNGCADLDDARRALSDSTGNITNPDTSSRALRPKSS